MAPVIPQVTSVTSESLQQEIRRLLPSQQGFGADLQATNVIVPIVDLTAAAEGSTLPTNLQQAISFGNITSHDIVNTTSNVITNTGFFRVYGLLSTFDIASGIVTASFDLSDGLSTKQIWQTAVAIPASNHGSAFAYYDFVVFMTAGDVLSGTTASAYARLAGVTYQVADVNGNLVNPAGYSPQ